jgi:hypothetical protein
MRTGDGELDNRKQSAGNGSREDRKEERCIDGEHGAASIGKFGRK